MNLQNKLGKSGEQMAVDYLSHKGYKILERNWRSQRAEIDIIALKNNVLAAIEVKTRSSDYFGDPQAFVNQRKMKLMVRAIHRYVVDRSLDVEVRFDIIGIIMGVKRTKILHLKDAFYHFTVS